MYFSRNICIWVWKVIGVPTCKGIIIMSSFHSLQKGKVSKYFLLAMNSAR